MSQVWGWSVHSRESGDLQDYLIGASDMAMIYISPDPYRAAFEEELNLQKFYFDAYCTAGLCFFQKDNHLLLASMTPSTPSARIPCWQTQLRGAWLIQIDDTPVKTIPEAQATFQFFYSNGATTCTLLFSRYKVTPNISNQGLLIMLKSHLSQFTHDQLNNQLDLLKEGNRVQQTRSYDIVNSGEVLNYTTGIIKITQGKLIH